MKISAAYFRPFARFLAIDLLDVFGMSKNDIIGLLSNVKNGNPIFFREPYTNASIVICVEQLDTKAKMFCEYRKVFAFVGDNILLVDRSDTRIYKGFVGIHSVTD